MCLNFDYTLEPHRTFLKIPMLKMHIKQINLVSLGEGASPQYFLKLPLCYM